MQYWVSSQIPSPQDAPLHQLSRPYCGEPGPLSQFIYLAPTPKSSGRWNQPSYLLVGKPTSKCRSCLGSLSWKQGCLSFCLRRCLAPSNMYWPWIFDTPTRLPRTCQGVSVTQERSLMSLICLSLHQLSIFLQYLSSPAHPPPDGVTALWGQAGWLHSATNPNGKYFVTK